MSYDPDYRDMGYETLLDLYTRLLAYQKGRIEKNDVLRHASDTIAFLTYNDRLDEIPFYEDFMHAIAD